MLKVGITSLGCPRNLVDSEVIAGSIAQKGFRLCALGDNVDVRIINTCSFIKSAKDESIDAIMEAVDLKKKGIIKYIVVCGCLPQLYKGALLKELEEVDMIVGTNEFAKIPVFLSRISQGHKVCAVSGHSNYLYSDSSPRILSTPRHYAYVKVSEGCRNRCSYCLIPRIRGVHRSRTTASVVREVRNISHSGTLKEVILIGQDTTLFGKDRTAGESLSTLIGELCRLENSVRWYRILYTHPSHYDDALIETIAREDKVCKYIDIPLQHVNNDILKNMNRKTSKSDIIKLLNKIRRSVPGIVLRTSLIVGFPGETEKQFNELLKFVKEMRFERLGGFMYSREDLTPASKLPHQVPDKIKAERLDLLMAEQRKISLSINKKFLNKNVEVLIDEKISGQKDRYLGRTYRDAPEIDGNVFVSGKSLKVGNFYTVHVNDAMEYDLAGEVS